MVTALYSPSRRLALRAARPARPQCAAANHTEGFPCLGWVRCGAPGIRLARRAHAEDIAAKSLGILARDVLPYLRALEPGTKLDPAHTRYLLRVQRTVYGIDYYAEGNYLVDVVGVEREWRRLAAFLGIRFPSCLFRPFLALLRRYQDVELAMRVGRLPCPQEPAAVLEWKSADVAMLRSIASALLGVKRRAEPEFRVVDVISELLDDLLDIDEDQHALNYNVAAHLIGATGAREGLRRLRREIDQRLLWLESRLRGLRSQVPGMDARLDSLVSRVDSVAPARRSSDWGR